MASKNKVNVTVKGKSNTSLIVGGGIGTGSSEKTENDVRVNIDGENLNTTVAGGNIIKSALFELHELLKSSLQSAGDKEELKKTVNELNEQIDKTPVERNTPKIKKLLKDLASYIGLADFAVVQMDRVKYLYKQIISFIN